MQKNVGSQKLLAYCWDSATGLPKTGDAANLTAYVSIDWGSVTALGDTSATEVDATNAKGYYVFDLTQGETNGNVLLFTCKSSTSGIVCKGAPDVVQTVPANFTLIRIDASGNPTGMVVKKNAAKAGFVFLMRDAVTGLGKTGLTITAKRSLDGAALAACANSASELSLGYYKIDLAATDLNGDTVGLLFTGAGAFDTALTIATQP